MTTGDVKRKLTAIFSADVEGYSRLMEEDELATVETLTSHKEIMRKLIKQYRGRVVDSTGDNLLAEFTSVVDAVQSAVEVQQVLSAKNEALPENRRMHFRIGINSGDVIEEGDLIYGDGVNVAARVESLAEGGGISISGTAYDQLGKKLPLGYEYIGEQSVKNIEKPVRVYRVLPQAEAAGKVIGEKRPISRHWRWAAVALIVVVGALVIWNFYFRPPFEPASEERMAFPLPDRPSIAVLPFDNVSKAPEQEYLSDGITENIITALSKTPNMFVIASNSVFTYKGKPVKIQQVAEELGVRYVLEGSVQRSGNQLRITAQLIDAIGGHHLWAERYDRDLKDIFALQDEITMKILTAMEVKLTEGQAARAHAKGTNNLEAYLKNLQAREHIRKLNKENNYLARELLKEAIALDPEYATAHVGLSLTHFWDIQFGWSNSPKKSFRQAAKLSEKALALDDSLDIAHGLAGMIYLHRRMFEKAISEGKKGIALGPNNTTNMAMLAFIYRYNGKPEESIELLEKVIRLDPIPPAYYLVSLADSYRSAGRYEDGIRMYKKVLKQNPNFGSFLPVNLSAAYILAGREDEARAAIEELLKRNPNLCIETVKASLKRRPYKTEDIYAHIIEGLRRAGLPETPPLPLPDKPSIAVLPFVNMSGDPEQEYFSDGISEEIINALSKSSKLFVIARESSFSYKGKQAKVPQIARELGVRYILEGSVRKSEDRVRITAQLIDGIKGQHLWSERYDRDLKDIFALQDEITMKIVTALRIKLTDGEQARIWGTKHENLDVLLKGMEALSLWIKGTREGFIRHAQVAQEIINMAPESSIGYRWLAWNHWYLARIGKSPRENILKAFKLANKALALDESNPITHSLLGSLYLVMRKYEKAIAAGGRSVELDPNGAMVHANLGITFNYAGRPDEAIGYLKQGIRLNPFPAYWYYRHLGLCYMQKGQHEKALTEFKKALRRSPDAPIIHANLAIVYILLDRHEEARAAAKKVSEIDPDFSVERALKVSPYKNQAFLKLVAEATHKAGLK